MEHKRNPWPLVRLTPRIRILKTDWVKNFYLTLAQLTTKLLKSQGANIWEKQEFRQEGIRDGDGWKKGSLKEAVRGMHVLGRRLW